MGNAHSVLHAHSAEGDLRAKGAESFGRLSVPEPDHLGPASEVNSSTGSREFLARQLGNAGVAALEGCVCGGSCGGCGREEERVRVWPSLVVGAVDDLFERQADRVAERVAGMQLCPGVRAEGWAPEPPALQRQEAGEQVEEEPGVNPILAQIEMLLAEEGVRAKATGGVESPSAQFESVLATSKGGGAALSGPVRGDMEAAFGADFGGVRVHTDRRAVGLSRELHAHAFTHGQDIYFNEGEFEPLSQEGRESAREHELTHTLQQSDRIHRMTITRHSRTRLTCGGSQTAWIFTLDNPAASAGYFVQRVSMYRTIENCPSNVQSISATPWLRFWEAMDVNSGDTRPSYHSAIGFSDMSAIPPEPGKSGCAAAVGSIKFFPRSTTGDLGSLGVAPSGSGSAWGPGKVAMSGDLPSTPTEPSWWSDAPTEGPSQRWASSWWNCCPDGPARNDTDSSP